MSSKKKRIGIFGGSFNPPHLGHLLATVYALQVYDFDEIWFVPAYRHAFGKKLVPFRHRFEMCKALIRNLSTSLKVSAIEQTVKSDGKALHTLMELSKRYPRTRFQWIIGSDLLKETKRWYRFSDIQKKYGVKVIPRGSRKGSFGIPDISSREIRRNLRSGIGLDRLVGKDIGNYIRRYRLY